MLRHAVVAPPTDFLKMQFPSGSLNAIEVVFSHACKHMSEFLNSLYKQF